MQSVLLELAGKSTWIVFSQGALRPVKEQSADPPVMKKRTSPWTSGLF